jgi:hypothetical protein
MTRLLKNFLIFCGVLGFIVASTLFILWPDKPLDEIFGLSQSSFEREASGGLPESASRIMRYTTGFADTARWISYSADKSEIEEVVRDLTGMKIEELDAWEPGTSSPVGRPTRPQERNKGYWDIEKITEGRKFYEFDGNKGTAILVDTKRWRIYIYESH